MQVDDPPYLSVGTAVSAKYKGAFCEAKVSKVVRIVKCKVTFKMGLGNATVNDEQIKGTLRVGQLVQAKHPEKKELVDATITKIQDCSQYTVVFDDGDITTLRRTALCLKSGRHFNESETLDQLPLTHPEHFGNPVVGGRRGRRNRQLKEDSSDGEMEEENEPDLEGYTIDIGRVVSVESTEKKRSRESWFPGLVVIPSAQPTVRINCKDEFLIRSFKDGRYYTVPKKEVSEFNREIGEKVESASGMEAVQKALKYLESSELPIHWERSSLFNSQNLDSDSEENITDSSDDEPCEEKDRFVAQLYKFMDDAGTPLNKTPTVSSRDIDLHRLFRVVHKLGGYNRVTNQNKWRSVTMRLHLPNNQNAFNQVKSIYKKCLLSYEAFHRTLGVTMLNHTRSTKKNRGRSLIRDKDRATPVNSSPKPEKEEEVVEKKEEVKEPPVVVPEVKLKRKSEIKKEEEKKNKKEVAEASDTNSSDATDLPPESIPSTSRDVGRPKRSEVKVVKEKKIKEKTNTAEKVKVVMEKIEEQIKKEDDDKIQQTRSKSQTNIKPAKEIPPSPSCSSSTPVITEKTEKEKKIKEEPKMPPQREPPQSKSQTPKTVKKPSEEEKKRGRKRNTTEEKPNPESSTVETTPTVIPVNIGDKLKVYYGPTHESKVTYEAKVIEIDKDSAGPVYLVHYTGWNTRYDEWISPVRIAENLSAATKAKRLKKETAAAASSSKNSSGKIPAKRGRGMSITGRSTAQETPRSTTPSSVTSSSSRTKSPGTPATRSTSRLTTRQDSSRRTRRISAQTDMSNHSESESDNSESETEMTRTRSGGKADEPEVKTYKRKLIKPLTSSGKTDKGKEKDDADTEKDEDSDKPIKRTRKIKKFSEKSGDESDDDINPPKGRDFDLNQIRSELKGFTKALKVPPLDQTDKDTVSSSDDSTTLQPEKPTIEEPEEDKKEKPLEKSSSSEDIYEFKEPEPFEFETRAKLVDEKNVKKRLVPRLFDDLDKSPKKKGIKSPGKIETPENSEVEKKRLFRRAPLRKQEDSEEEEDIISSSSKKDEDPFDKLVESPSFNIVKTATEKLAETKAKVVRNILDEPLSLFRELPETVEDYTEDMELSDTESQTQHIFTRSNDLFSDTTIFSKSDPPLDLEFPLKLGGCKLKDSDDEDLIRAQIQRVIQQSSSTDEDSNDVLSITPSTTSYQVKKREETKPLIDLKIEEKEIKNEASVDAIPSSAIEVEVKKEETSVIVEKSAFAVVKQISPALQETDSSLLESMCAQPVLLATKLDDGKELNVKTGTKIADSILQKFNSIKNKIEGKSSKPVLEVEKKEEVKVETKPEPPPPLEVKVDIAVEVKSKTIEVSKSPVIQETKKPVEIPKPKVVELSPVRFEGLPEGKKRRKILSRAYIEESDSDSSDSEQLVIARSDEDSQTNSLDNKPDTKESDSNISVPIPPSTDDSQTQEEERNFKFEDLKKDTSPAPIPIQEEEIIPEPEPVKEEEPDSQLHSLLLCEETLPRSPAPASEGPSVVEPKPAKSVLEMPFASAPGTSNTKCMLLEHKNLVKIQPPPLVIPPPAEREIRPAAPEVAAVLDNTPPTTPDSSISNLSPRGDGDLSPNTADNESCKSIEAELEYPIQRRNSTNKVTPYSEEDTQMTGESSGPTVKKPRDDSVPATKKRRKSFRGPEDVPVKRGRRPLNRSRHNSDSDDTSEHSTSCSTNIGIYERSQRSPRPSKYNFFVEFDPSLDSSQRISVLQHKLSELRKTYADVKTELAAVERRRKKIKRREREAQKASKQEMACA